jgi:hypothetical protein
VIDPSKNNRDSSKKEFIKAGPILFQEKQLCGIRKSKFLKMKKQQLINH